MRTVLYGQFHVRTLITGYDNRFGHNRSEGFADYVRHGASMGMEVVQGAPFTVDGIRVSSSVVRRCLAQGDVTTASRCLGRPYTIEAPVVSGQQEGRRMGFRTANIDTASIGKMLPRGGAYATRVRIDGAGEWLPAMTNIGTRPTFDGVGVTVETNILDFCADVYGHRLQVALPMSTNWPVSSAMTRIGLDNYLNRYYDNEQDGKRRAQRGLVPGSVSTYTAHRKHGCQFSRRRATGCNGPYRDG